MDYFCNNPRFLFLFQNWLLMIKGVLVSQQSLTFKLHGFVVYRVYNVTEYIKCYSYELDASGECIMQV